MIFIVGGYDSEKGVIYNEYEMFDIRENKMSKSSKKWKLIKLNKIDYNAFNDIFMGGIYTEKNKVMIFGGKNLEKRHNIKYFHLTQQENEYNGQNNEEIKISISYKNNSFVDENKFKFEYTQFLNNYNEYCFEFDKYNNKLISKNVVYLFPKGDSSKI